MASVTIAVHNVTPHPMLAAALRRITGRGIGEIAAALSNNAPLFQTSAFDALDADQLDRVRQLLKLIDVAAATPVIAEDGRPMDLAAFQAMLDAAMLMVKRARSSLDQRLA